ncbi:hypothetical protein L0F63_003560, partial [Massospora cicadina]
RLNGPILRLHAQHLAALRPPSSHWRWSSHPDWEGAFTKENVRGVRSAAWLDV